MPNYYSIQDPVIHEIDIKKSRFITYLYPIRTEEEFDEHLRAIRKEHYKATHHCQAYILEDDHSIQRANDDGEPSGTAGMPMLEVLKQNELTYIMAVVVRYFGGVKLGAGGLIRAYSSAVSEALKEATIIQNLNQQVVRLTLDYNQVDLFQYFMETCAEPVTQLDVQYTEKVQFDLAIRQDRVQAVHDDLVDRFNGAINWQEVEVRTIDIPVKD